MFVCPDKLAAIIVSKTVIQKFIYSNYFQLKKLCLVKACKKKLPEKITCNQIT